MADRSKKALIAFLDYLSAKGLMNSATAASRKAAVSRVLGILGNDEIQDVTSIDLDELMTRFHHLEGSKYTPSSLSVYKSRVKSAIDDFQRYQKDPLNFKPATPAAPRRPDSKASSMEAPISHQRPTMSASEAPPASVNIIPIPIRPDLTIKIQGLPYDLTGAEATKIANVIKAMAATD